MNNQRSAFKNKRNVPLRKIHDIRKSIVFDFVKLGTIPKMRDRVVCLWLKFARIKEVSRHIADLLISFATLLSKQKITLFDLALTTTE